MRITSLELENVKSYVRRHIDFSEGLNAVCGQNGSGKTTILEAIGFALFDYLPYNQAAFIREGEKSATIRVRLLARDGREYEVVRKIGSGGAYFVSDVELNTRLAERGPNVLEWIRTRALDMEGAVELGSLFKNAVGVPQGQITADFTHPGNTRKAVFDPLLRVAEYRDAWEHLRETASYLNSLSGTMEKEIEGLEEQTQALPDLEAEVADGETKLGELDLRLEQYEIERRRTESEKTRLDALRDRLRELERQVENAHYDVQRYSDMLRSAQDSLQRSVQAQEVVAQTEHGYRLVVGARERLRELDRERVLRDELEKRFAAATGELQAIHARLETLQSQWNEAREAADAAALLVDDVARQTALELDQREREMRLQAGASVRRTLERLGAEVESLRTGLQTREARIAEAQGAGDKIGRLGEVQDRLAAVGTRLGQIESYREQRSRVERDGKLLRQRFDTLAAEVDTHRTLQQRIAVLEQQAAPLEALTVREGKLRDERTRVLATIEYQSVAWSELQRHHCPLLDLTCPVVERDAAALDGFDVRVGVLRGRAAEIDASLAQLGTEVLAVRSAASELQQAQIRAAALERSAEQIEGVELELKQFREHYAELTEAITAGAELEKERDALTADLDGLQKLATIAALLPELRDQQSRDQVVLEGKLAELGEAEAHARELGVVEGEYAALATALQELGDPRARQQALLARAARKNDLEAQLELQQTRLDEQNHKLQAFVGEKQRFVGVDEAMAEQRSLEQTHAPDHDRYLQHREEAGRFDDCCAAVAAAEERVQAAHAAAAELEGQVASTRELYDAEHHASVEQALTFVLQEIAACKSDRVNAAGNLQKAQSELARVRRLRDRLEERRAELEDVGRTSAAVGFVRDTLKAAGPAITETILANISGTANDIFAEIMDDHAAELRWTRDYEVVVQRGAEERRFAQLSGGEQMSAALAVRLALLREMSEIDFAFFDEPTQNMDSERRGNLAEQIRAVRGFDQLIVISHDDTFEHHTDNFIRLAKEHEETVVDAG